VASADALLRGDDEHPGQSPRPERKRRELRAGDLRGLPGRRSGERRLADFDLLCLPGGFSDGDDLGAAQASANRIRHSRVGGSGERLHEALERFVRDGKLVIGICNGFQLLVKLGLLPWPTFERRVTLTFNKSGRFEDRWVALAADPASPCIFTRGIDRIDLPVRHGEGRLVLDGEETGQALLEEHLVPLRYAHPATGTPTDLYPWDPNGSWAQAAALCDPTGRTTRGGRGPPCRKKGSASRSSGTPSTISACGREGQSSIPAGAGM
jgi:phosphoribosylformylglycinamidine (FGAM) synthase-like amidotransferase family enzyme